jgi:hypothetical protein
MTSLTFLTALRTPVRVSFDRSQWDQLTLSNVGLASVSELNGLVLTGGSTRWDGGSEETLGGGDVNLDGRVTCSSQQYFQRTM